MGYTSSLSASGIVAPQLLFNAPPATNTPASSTPAASAPAANATPAAALPIDVPDTSEATETAAAASLARQLGAAPDTDLETLTSPLMSDATLQNDADGVANAVNSEAAMKDDPKTADQRHALIGDYVKYMDLVKSSAPDGYQGSLGGELNLDRSSVNELEALQAERSAEPDL